ncbi:MAG: DUF6895 family protein [Streptomyces sp.]|uniref:DUF6895 family protein n=1 Tax=Streptomyces sp. TaxID=1931 RepID=UPI003D6AADE7
MNDVGVAELDRVSLAALSWLRGHLPDFRLPADAGRPDVDRNVTLKPLGELAQLSLSTLRASEPDSTQHQLAREMLDFAWEETSQGELFLSLVRDEPHATYPMEIYGSFAEAGLHQPEFEEYARFMATTRAWRLTEYDPTRALALFNTERRMGVPAHPGRDRDRDREEAMRRTWLGGLAEPWSFELRAGYALTHYVFHVTDWGQEPGRLPAEVCDYLTLWLPSWLDSCVANEHWDLTGELLAVAAALPEPVPVAEAWQAYATTAQSMAGAVAESGPPPTRETADTFLSCYHSTVAGAFAAVLAAGRLRAAAPPVTAAGGGRP